MQEAPRDGNSPFLTCILFKGKWTQRHFFEEFCISAILSTRLGIKFKLVYKLPIWSAIAGEMRDFHQFPHGLQPWRSTRKCSRTTLVFTVHQMHPRNPARISQVPTFCWWHYSYLLQREIIINTRDIPARCCHDPEDMVGWKRSLPKCGQNESHVLATCHLCDPSRHYRRIFQHSLIDCVILQVYWTHYW